MKRLTVEEILAMLREGPSRIADAVADASPDKLQVSAGTNEWSATEILGHLRACADVWGRCIDTILAGNNPTIRAVNPRTWIQSTDYLKQYFRTSLRAFTRQRADLLAVLDSLSPKEWRSSATVTGAGKPLVRTVYDYAIWLASHERPHIKQIRRQLQSEGFREGSREPNS